MVEGGNLSAAIGVMIEICKYKKKRILDHGLSILLCHLQLMELIRNKVYQTRSI